MIKKITISSVMIIFGLLACNESQSLLEELNIQSQSDIEAIENAVGTGDVSNFNGIYDQPSVEFTKSGSCTDIYSVTNIEAKPSGTSVGGVGGYVQLNTSLLGDYSGAIQEDGTVRLVAGTYEDVNNYHIEIAEGRFYEESDQKKLELNFRIEEKNANAGIDCSIGLSKPAIFTRVSP